METTQHIEPPKNLSALCHPPSYYEANVPYSLRLPAYRSSYMRRFHPYARYVTPPPERYATDGGDDDDVLDLSNLDQRVPYPALEPAQQLNVHVVGNNDNAYEDVASVGGDEAVGIVAEPGRVHDSVGELEEAHPGVFAADVVTVHALRVLRLK